METMIRVCDVEKYYGKNRHLEKVIDRISFEIEEEEFVGIMGASGSGKTTLLNMIAAIDQVTSGHIFYGEKDITEMKEDDLADFRKGNLGFVFQDFRLLDTLTLGENIILAMTLQKKKPAQIQDRLEHLSKVLDIGDILDKFPYEVSGGQKQKCACARALANEPELILADEPTGALDSKSARMLLQTLCFMNETLHAAILMVTHDAFSASYCKRILFLKDGRIFNEIRRGNQTREEFLGEILDVLSLMGGDSNDAF